MENIIEIESLNKKFISENGEEIFALKNIDLEIKDTEFICLLGPSGSGKSTLLRIMAGLDKPTSGEIKILNSNINEVRDKIGMVFQEYSLLPWRKIIDNVAFGLEIKKIPKKIRYDKSKEILKKFNLEGFENNYTHELSGGMRQRVAIAKAIVDSPKILYMDEPFGALDAQTRILMQEELIEFWIKEKRTIVFVTHSIEEAIFLGTRVVVMSDRPGRIIDDFKIDLEYPRNRWSKEFEKFFERLMDTMDLKYK